MKLKLMAAFVVLAAGGAVVLGTLGGDGKPVDVVAQADSVKVIDGPCPVSTGPTQEAAKCKGSYEKDGMCFCITDQKDVDGEAKSTDPSKEGTAKVKRLWVCPNAKDPKGTPSVRWDTDADTPPKDCIIAAKALVDVSMGDYSTDLVEQLQAACSPCPVTGSSWGPCPYCLGTDGGCAAACK